MISQSQYNRITAPDWKGKRVRSLVPLNTSQVVVPAGTEFTVEGKFNGLDILGDACSHCGVQVRISRVNPSKLELVDAN